MYRVINKETGQVYLEADTICGLNALIQPIYSATKIHCVRKGDSYTYYYQYMTPELLAMLDVRMPIMDKVAGVLMLGFIVLVVLGLGGLI